MVIYDPDDPYLDLYDVDDGEHTSLRQERIVLTRFIETTIITLADWYFLLFLTSPYSR